MIYKLSDLDLKMKDFIIKSYKLGHSIQDIQKSLNVSRNTIIALLNNVDVDVKRIDYPSFNINGNKVLVIADTHIGSHKENLSYIDKAYNEAIKNNVCACLHLGDLLQGEYDRTNKPLDYQLDILGKKYPKVIDFKTYLLLGNHDYSIFESNQEAKCLLESKNDFEVLGYKKAYFEWCSYMFCMEHKVKQINEEMLNEIVALSFIGHGHELKNKSSSKLKAPTLSDDIINKENGAYPAFLIASLIDDYLDVDVYNFSKDIVKIKKKSYTSKQLIDMYKVKWD